MSSNFLTSSTQLALMQAAQSETQKSVKGLDAAKMKKVEEAAADFEAVFTSEMMKPMFEGIATDGPFGGGKGEEVFRDMLVQEYGKIMARTGSIGIAGPVKEQMIKMQEQADNATHATITE
jgi:flagellar protein FlgJ